MRSWLVSFFVFSCLLLLNIFAFASWDKTAPDYLKKITKNETLGIQNLNPPSGKTLVPKGAVLGENEIDEIAYNYLFEVVEGADVNISIEDINFSKAGIDHFDQQDLLAYDISIERINDLYVSVSIIFSLRMPENLEEYEIVSGSLVTFRVNLIEV